MINIYARTYYHCASNAHAQVLGAELELKGV